MQTIPTTDIRNILVLGSIGLGNLLLFSPALRVLRSTLRDARITLIVLGESFQALYEGEPDVDEVIVIRPGADRTPAAIWALIRRLRRTPWDLAITTFPANRLEYNLLPWIAGARYRIAHRYPTKNWRSCSFLQNVKIPVDPDLHDLEQNNALLQPLGCIVPPEQPLVLTIPDAAERDATRFLEDNTLQEKTLVAVHPGSSVERNMHFKRWPAENFAACCRLVAESIPATFLILGGGSESDIKQQIVDAAGGVAIRVDGLSLKATAALMRRCRCALTNDSGLMHIAAAVNLPVIALFGPSDPVRTRPWGEDHVVIRKNLDCSPCWGRHNLGVGRVDCIYDENRCMQQITVEEVAIALRARLMIAPDRPSIGNAPSGEST